MYLDSDFPLQSPEVPQSLETCEEINAWLCDKIESLIRSVNSQQAEKILYKNRWETSIEKHRDDIEIISNALIAEAEKRDWCSDYDEFVDKLNGHLHKELTTRYTVYSVEATYTVTISRDVRALSEEEAIEMFNENEGLESQRWSVSDFDDWDQLSIEVQQ
jgi:hypothetical protein